MDLIIFYISEYFAYIIIMAIISAAIILLAWRHRNADNIRSAIVAIIISYCVIFTGVGGLIKPYFTDRSQYLDLKKYGPGGFGHGTGSFVNPTDVMTNAHVVQNCTAIEVRAKSGNYSGKIIAVLERKKGDIAFIRTDAKEKKFIVLSQEDPKVGDIVFFPNYTSNPISFDKARAKITLIDDELEFLAPHGRQGNSGSPLYNKKGYVIGIVHGEYFFALKPIMVATDAKTIADFALKNKVTMFYTKKRDEDLTQNDGFFEDFAVTVICAHKR